MGLWGFQKPAPTVPPISVWLCRYFGVSPLPLLDKRLQFWVKKDLPFYMGAGGGK